jgi:hypothetical protein
MEKIQQSLVQPARLCLGFPWCRNRVDSTQTMSRRVVRINLAAFKVEE